MSSPLPRLRLAAAAFALLAFVLRLTTPYWWELTPLDGLDLPGVVLLDFAVFLAVTAGLPFACYRLLLRGFGEPPTTFTVSTAGFTAPASPENGYQLILWGFLVGGFPLTEQAAGGGRIVAVDSFDLAAGALALIALAVSVGRMCWRGPQLTLTPDHLEIRIWRTRRIEWARLAPGGPVPPEPGMRLGLLVARPDGRYELDLVRHRRLHVDVVFLAAAVRHYADHVEHRAAIGTEPELRRLREALARKDAHPVVAATRP